MPQKDSVRAAVVATIVLLATATGAATLAIPVAATDDTELILEDPMPGTATNHTWIESLDGSVDDDLDSIRLDYSDTGVNLSEVDPQNVWVGIGGTDPLVQSTVSSDGDQILEIELDGQVTLAGGETINVGLFDDSVVNPPEEGTHGATIGFYDAQDAEIASATTAFDIGPPTGTVGGVVVDNATEHPIEGADVTLEKLDGTEVDATVTDPGGFYQFENNEGTYVVNATASGYGSNETTVELEYGFTKFEELALDVDPSATGTIEGTVVNATDGSPVDGATVHVIDGQSPVATLTTDGTGAYSADVVPSTYDVVVSKAGYNQYMKESVTVVEEETTTVDIALVPGEANGVGDLDDVTVENLQITDTDGNPVAGLEVINYTSNLVGLSVVNESLDQDISDVVDTDTELRLYFEVGNFTPDVLIGTAENATWSTESIGENTTAVTINGTPGSAQYIVEENGDHPSLGDWPEDEAEDVATLEYAAMFDFAVIELQETMDAVGQVPPIEGTIITTDAQSFSMPSYDDVEEELSIEIAGPHYETDGVTVNDGFFDAYLPPTLLDEWGVDDTGDLEGAYQGQTADIEVTESDRGDGWDLSIDVHYSAGEVAITPVADEEGDGNDGGSGGGAGGFGGGGVADGNDGDDGDDEIEEGPGEGESDDERDEESGEDDEEHDVQDEESGEDDEENDERTENSDGDEASGGEDGADADEDASESTDDDGGSDEEDDETPGFGIVLALLTLLIAGGFRHRSGT